MMKRKFLNLVMENLDTCLYSLRPSISPNISSTHQQPQPKRQRHGKRFLQATASSLGPLPSPTIHFKPGGPSDPRDTPLDVVTLLGDENRILCADTTGRTSLYDADSHTVVTVPDLAAPKGINAIPICISRAAAGGSAAAYNDEGDNLYVLSRTSDPDRGDGFFEELRYNGGRDVFSHYQLHRGWIPVPPPPPFFHPVSCRQTDMDAYTVVGGSTIYVSCSDECGVRTYAFDTTRWQWSRAGNWKLPFHGRSEHVPELNLWFGLSGSRPHHLCAADLSTANLARPPAVLHTWVDFDMPKSWEPTHVDLINLGSGRFCVVKMFESTEEGYYSHEDKDDEALDYPDMICSEFAVLTGVEVVRCGAELRMIKHVSKYHIFEDDLIHWVL